MNQVKNLQKINNYIRKLRHLKREPPMYRNVVTPIKTIKLKLNKKVES